MKVFLTRLLALCALAVAGCAELPARDLDAYADSFTEARLAGDLLLDEVAPLFPSDAAIADCAVDPGLGYRPCFDAALALGDDAARRGEPSDIRVRRAALALIGGYNELLVDLGRGRSAEELDARLGSVESVAGAVLAFAPGGAGVLAGVPLAGLRSLLTKVETIRAGDAAASSVTEAEDDIRALIRFMIADTSALYAVYVAPIDTEIGVLKILAEDARDDRDVAEAMRLAERRAALADRALAFEAALIAYVRLLDRTDRSLGDLAAAIRTPRAGSAPAAADFARQATEARLMAEQFLSNVRAMRAPGF
ncbi:MAG: hypothetical protein WD969_04345 [Paracoccaceae bacterium]